MLISKVLANWVVQSFFSLFLLLLWIISILVFGALRQCHLPGLINNVIGFPLELRQVVLSVLGIFLSLFIEDALGNAGD